MAPPVLEQVVVDEAGEAVEGRLADRLGGVQPEAAGEHGRPLQVAALRRLEQLVAPLERRPQGPLARGEIVRPSSEQRHAGLEPLEELGGSQGAHPARGELDREREPVETRADRGDRAFIFLAQPHVRRDAPRTLVEEGAGRVRRQRLDRIDVLAREVQHDSARDEQADARGFREQLGEDREGGREVLGVVEQDKELPVRERGPEGGAGIRRLLDSDRAGDCARDELRVAKRREVDEDGAVRERRSRLTCGLEREPRLARPAGTGQRDQAHLCAVQQRGEFGELAFASEERPGEAGSEASRSVEARSAARSGS